jgi:hypothetical protein
MRLYGPTSTRAAPTDRFPTTIAVGADAIGIAGPVTNVLATYTVPTGRRFVGEASISATVTTAGAAGTRALVRLFVTKSGGAVADIAGQWTEDAPGVGVKVSVTAVPVQLNPGDKLDVQLILGAATPVVSAIGGIQGVEYDF